MAINHDKDYHGEINYGNLYPEDWYWFDTSDETRLENIIDFDKGRLTSTTSQRSARNQGPQ